MVYRLVNGLDAVWVLKPREEDRIEVLRCQVTTRLSYLCLVPHVTKVVEAFGGRLYYTCITFS